MTAKKTPVTPARSAAVTAQLAYQTMPRSVKIGCYDFAIEVMDHVEGEASNAYGYNALVLQKIRILAGMSAKKLANTFMHEVLHGIHWFHGLRDESDEEEFTLLGTNGLCAFFQDNPEAARWFMAANGGRE